MKQLIPFLLWALSAFCLHAQHEITGFVQDADTHMPVSYAQVLLDGRATQVLSDSSGSFQFPDIPAGRYLLRVSCVGYVSSQQAIQVPLQDVLQLRLSPSMYLLEQVVVRALRHNESIPMSSTTLEAKALLPAYVGQDAPFLLQEKTPSLLVSSQAGTGFGNYAQLSLRGLDETRINLTLDGIPLNDMIDQGFYFSNFVDILGSLSSVQIQRGVGTSTHGVASHIGSINMTSRPLYRASPAFSAHMAGGSFGSFKLSAEAFSGRLPQQSAAYVRGSYLQSDGYRSHSGTEATSAYAAFAHFREKTLWKLSALIGNTQNDLAYRATEKSVLEEQPRANPLSANETDDFTQALVALQRSHFLRPQQQHSSTLYYGHAQGIFPFGSDNADGSYAETRYGLTNHHLGGMSSWRYTPSASGIETHIGLHGYLFWRQNTEATAPDRTNFYYSDRSRKAAASVFAKLSYAPGRWYFFGDMQVRALVLRLYADAEALGQEAHIPARRWLFANPKVGMAYHWTERLSSYASVALSHREPTRNDLLGDTNINAGVLSALQDTDRPRPERVYDGELGLRYKRTTGKLEANFFYMRFRDEIMPIGEYIEDFYAQLRKNVPRSARWGIELQGEGQLLDKLSLSGQGTWMRTRIDTYSPQDGSSYRDRQAALSPEWLLHARVDYRLLRWLGLWTKGRYQGMAYLEPSNQATLTLPSSFVLDVGAQVDWKERYVLAFHVGNVLDRRYYLSGEVLEDGDTQIPGYWIQAPRNFFISLRVNMTP